ncbi:hypothetical protein [Actinomadura kijaniata]|uniref:hypothetical protein n=1 Tax=Actinomadura kijaniata TaxID=46161 RepID=UPI000836ADEC|nr:hypothetical protein [Actinomadura kijaniata]
MNPLLHGLAVNPSLPPALRERLVATADRELAWELAGREDLTRAQAASLVARFPECAAPLAERGTLTADGVDPEASPDIALALLGQGRGRPEWARVLVADPDAGRREKLAECPGLPSDVAETLAADPHAGVRAAVAGNAATPPRTLAALVTGEGLPPARTCLVCEREEIPFFHDPYCPRTDCDLPPGAACDGSHEYTAHALRMRAIANPATPAGTVARFADDPSMLLRCELARRTDLPATVYERLAASPEPGVRSDLAANPAIGERLMRALAADTGHDVRRDLARNPRLPLDVLVTLAGTVKAGPTPLPRIAAASPAEVAELAAHPDAAVRMPVARRRDLPDGIRDALAADPDAKVADAVAPHPGLPEERLRAMLERHGARVAAGIAANPDAPAALLEELARRHPVAKALREIARRPDATAAALLACLADRRARRAAAGHPALPPDALVALLDDADGETATAAAANPSLPFGGGAGVEGRLVDLPVGVDGE